MFAGKVKILPLSGAPLRCFTWIGYGLTRANFRLGWKGLARTNTPAYWGTFEVTKRNVMNTDPEAER